MLVKIGKVPGKVSEVALEAGSTVADALEQAEILDASTFTIEVNGRKATSSTELNDGDIALLLPQIKGNN